MATNSTRSAGSQVTQRGIVQGSILVDPVTGLPINVIVDGTGKKRLAVDAALSVESAVIEVALDSTTDAVRVEDPVSGAYIKVETDGSINVNTSIDAKSGDNVAISGHLNPIFDEDLVNITSSSATLVFSYTSTHNNTRVSMIDVSVSTPSDVEVKIGSTVIRKLRTSSLERNARFSFTEPRPLLNGEILTVYAKVERFILTTYESFTSMEGFLA